jgi:pimeloyl-ACP methyl ester carboxylesterase
MRRVTVPSPRGHVRCEQFGEPAGTAILWAFGAGGGFGGPAGGVYTRLGERFAAESTGSLCVDYRHAGYLQPCVEDVLTGIDYLVGHGATDVLLVGHSFGGAVVIQASVRDVRVSGVAALSSQSHGTWGVKKVSPRPLLLIHGQSDEILPFRCSEDIYSRAKEPRQLILYRGCLHGLDQCVEALDRDLKSWLRANIHQKAQPQ